MAKKSLDYYYNKGENKDEVGRLEKKKRPSMLIKLTWLDCYTEINDIDQLVQKFRQKK